MTHDQCSWIGSASGERCKNEAIHSGYCADHQESKSKRIFEIAKNVNIMVSTTVGIMTLIDTIMNVLVHVKSLTDELEETSEYKYLANKVLRNERQFDPRLVKKFAVCTFGHESINLASTRRIYDMINKTESQYMITPKLKSEVVTLIKAMDPELAMLMLQTIKTSAHEQDSKRGLDSGTRSAAIHLGRIITNRYDSNWSKIAISSL